ncbi:hypothetical protein [Ethanoligenens harbinense]|uniref:Uncharacterized protein n=1 Tax=Ethanoligenens harbinense (strain DSM 18485 / JCM 12961 / CGMCC 1.5033 / YUAN-3) TaxID=663278 RepID=E6U407_ETHHY|nr:hypothetical protein [Ethanoligenens harbinense]ADU27687.1 hypothetical protein Ethha_2170 [Ethanoligenens harbinense YUAN-3]AVQ96722.1 hypothetical protein CXQ68_11165 [Ethanoligenens harbinense YUAN-3]AYF39382.1 hypothetical protein CXP51_11055 [Ethanoligenens harbinense]AYF42206.1 hypothetical protein CN246_11600 [Ethanoligenens harbinense]QCN92962.1 hypothetical protein DRA42_11195 [Ethanoligenens harbinense]
MKRELPGIVLGDMAGTALFICLTLAVRAQLSAAAWVLLAGVLFCMGFGNGFCFQAKAPEEPVAYGPGL